VTGHLLCNELAPHKVNAAAYTKIYARISAGPQAFGASMWKNVRNATLGTASIVVWFAVVTLGFGAQLWPLLEGMR
jgi:hypothetical protein